MRAVVQRVLSASVTVRFLAGGTALRRARVA
jgi:hypothetical protein